MKPINPDEMDTLREMAHESMAIKLAVHEIDRLHRELADMQGRFDELRAIRLADMEAR
jgi:hypothetical protein